MSNAPKVQIPVTNAFGQQSVKQIELDNNRFDIYTETLSRFANAVAIPTRGIYTDALQWILGFAVPFRVLDTLALWGIMPDVLMLVILAIAVMPVVTMGLMLWGQLAKFRWACFYRICLVTTGFLVATWGIW
ncbi:MAG: hypothetical protein AAF959_10815 [Cyanobacteria bacterium P01_D01_bin.56]